MTGLGTLAVAATAATVPPVSKPAISTAAKPRRKADKRGVEVFIDFPPFIPRPSRMVRGSRRRNESPIKSSEIFRNAAKSAG
jgi:hypothetical protein